MSDSSENVVPMRAGAAKRRPPPNITAQLATGLERHKARLGEAMAVAELLSVKLLESRPETITASDIDLAVRSCDAVARMLADAASELTVASIICTPQGE